MFDLCLDEGDIALTEDPTYSGALSALNPTGCRLVGSCRRCRERRLRTLLKSTRFVAARLQECRATRTAWTPRT